MSEQSELLCQKIYWHMEHGEVRKAKECIDTISTELENATGEIRMLEEERTILAERRDAQLAEIRAELGAAKADNERLREALKKYGRHLNDCRTHWYTVPCTCGLDAAKEGK